jgi:hypothetical protein
VADQRHRHQRPDRVEIAVAARQLRLVSSASFRSGSEKACCQYSSREAVEPKVSLPFGVAPKEKTAMTTIGISR